MNNFEQLYKSIITEAGDITKIGIFPGAFKPPHVGHYTTALNACKDNDIVYIYISSKPRALSTQNKAPTTGGKDCDGDRYKNMMTSDKYTNNLLSVQPAACARMTSASAMRVAISAKDKNTIFKNLPDGCDKDTIYNILMQSNDISSDEYGHVTIQQTLEIWKHYQQLLISATGKSNEDIRILASDITPVRDTYELVDTLNKSDSARNISVRLYVGT